MALRADARVFIPGAAAGDAGMAMSKGDRLIQELASALMSPRLDALSEQPMRKMVAAVVPPGLDAPCCLLARPNKTYHITKPKVVIGPVLGVTSLRMLPAAGIFCPYCVAGDACAFHRPGGLATETHIPANVQAFYKLADCSDTRVGAPGCAAMELMLDGGSDAPDSEEASTDIGVSDAFCAASDASDSQHTFPGGEMMDGIVANDDSKRFHGSKSHNKIHGIDKEPLAGEAGWGRHKRCEGDLQTFPAR